LGRAGDKLLIFSAATWARANGRRLPPTIKDLGLRPVPLQALAGTGRSDLTHELDAARAETDNLRQGLDTLRRQRQEDVPQGQPDYSAITREIVEDSEEQSS
jgi:hypothetical protein